MDRRPFGIPMIALILFVIGFSTLLIWDPLGCARTPTPTVEEAVIDEIIDVWRVFDQFIFDENIPDTDADVLRYAAEEWEGGCRDRWWWERNGPHLIYRTVNDKNGLIFTIVVASCAFVDGKVRVDPVGNIYVRDGVTASGEIMFSLKHNQLFLRPVDRLVKELGLEWDLKRQMMKGLHEAIKEERKLGSS